VCRVSVVDQNGELLYNSFVKPANPIVNYATQYSGITEELLAPVTTTLEEVQRKLAEIIDYDTVLVGHSLNCDLVVLKLVHPWIVDTSVIYHHTRGPPFKASLKWLASKWLGKEIQKPHKAGGLEVVGHNSEEDARAAVQLLRLKMQKGKLEARQNEYFLSLFCRCTVTGPTFGEFVTDQESIFERLSRAEPRRKTSIIDHGNPAQWHGAKADTALGGRTDAEVRILGFNTAISYN
jgi:RNA exonuclease 1